MDPIPTHRCGARRPCLIPHHHHHHHHHYHCHLVLCPHQHQHRQMQCFCNCHRHANPNFASYPKNPRFTPPSSLQKDLTSGFEEAHHSAHHQMLEEQENGGLEEEEEDDDDEPVFVLTDEWKEFFAKSEAERKLKKKQANKGKK